MAAHRARGHRGRRARRLDVAHDRAPGDRRRARARHVRRRGRAVRHRAGRSASAGTGRVRARARGRDGRGPRRRPRRRWTGCAGSRREIGRPVTFALLAARPRPRPVDAACSTSRSRRTTRACRSGRRSRAGRSGCCSGSRRSTRSRAGRATRRSTACRSTRRSPRMRDPEVRARDPRRERRRRRPAAWRSSAWASTASSRSASRPTTSPHPDQSIAALAERAGVDPSEYLYDLLLQDDGRELLLRPLLGYTQLHARPDPRDDPAPRRRALGLGDGGAHCGVDLRRAASRRSCSRTGCATAAAASASRSSWSCSKMTSDTAALYGLGDRGVLAPGKQGRRQRHRLRRAHAAPPEMVHDLPGGARRLIQQADGYDATIVGGAGHHAQRRGDRRPPRRTRARRPLATIIDACTEYLTGTQCTHREHPRTGGT